MIDHLISYPRRIICLTEETTETLYLLGEQERIVGVSGYTVRPPEARLKPKVSAFINAKFDKILALEPDMVFAFSDLQADIAAELIRRGVTVMTFNQRSIAEILDMILTVGVSSAAKKKLGRWLRCCRLSWMPFATRLRASLMVRESCSKNGTTHSSPAFVGSRS